MAPQEGSAQTAYQWGREFNGTNAGEIEASVVYDDGTGPALYLAGEVLASQGEVAFGVLRFDGVDWAPVGGGLTAGFNPPTVNALEVYDPDGPGPQKALLVAAGTFFAANGSATPVNNIAAWDGTSWAPLGNGISSALSGQGGPEVYTLKSWDDGSGPKLYAGGIFSVSGSSGMAVWDGSTWGSIGGAGLVAGWAHDMEVCDLGTGPELFVGGNFSGVLGAAGSSGLASWDGTTWTGTGGSFSSVQALTAFDPDGAGPAPDKVVAAAFGNLDVWDGATATHVTGTGGALTPAVTTFDDGTGPAVYLGPNGNGGVGADRLMRWDGVASSLTSVGSPFITGGLAMFVETLIEFGGELYAGGLFGGTASVPAFGLLKWSGSDWLAPLEGDGLGNYTELAPRVVNAVVFDDGLGEELFVASDASYGGKVAFSSGVGAWDGSAWRDAGLVPSQGGTFQGVVVMTAGDLGAGPALFAMIDESNPLSSHVAQLKAGAWSPVGAGTSSFSTNFVAQAQGQIYDDGSGPALYVASGPDLHRWDGSTWTVVASVTGLSIRDLDVFDDGSGAKLIVSGDFTAIGGVGANRIASFDGTSWSSLGSGISNGANLVVTDDGSGMALYAGKITSAGGVAGTAGVARWDGTQWSSLGGGDASLVALIGAHSDGVTNRIYALSYDYFQCAWASQIRVWDGAQWSSLPNSYLFGEVFGMASFNDGLPSGTYFWGSFPGTGGTVVDPTSTVDMANQSSGLVRFGLPVPADSPFVVSGVGCSQYSIDIPTIHGQGLAQVGTSSFSTTVKNVPAGMPAALLIGTATDFWSGIPLPFDMAPLGWAGCNLYQNWQYTFWTATSGVGMTGGEASLPLALPSLPSLVGFNLPMQWAVLVLNPTGFDLGVTPLGVVTLE